MARAVPGMGTDTEEGGHLGNKREDSCVNADYGVPGTTQVEIPT